MLDEDPRTAAAALTPMADAATDYRQAYEASVADPDAFWGDKADRIDWIRKPKRVLDADRPPFYRWFPDGTLNTCYNALDRHVVAGHAERTALVYDSPVTGTQQRFSYSELLEKVASFAGALRAFGVEKGDRVVIYMPMIPEAVVAMLACARIGAVHSVVFGGFAAHELAVRIDDARSALDHAMWAATHHPEEAALTASMAAVTATSAQLKATADNIQVHGGIGFTWEHTAHLHFRRARSNAALFGDVRHHHENVLSALGL